MSQTAATIACILGLSVACSSAAPERVNVPARVAKASQLASSNGRNAAPGAQSGMCGRPSPSLLTEPASSRANTEFDACTRAVKSKLDRLQALYLNDANGPFPLGLGLEDRVRESCLDAGGSLYASFRKAGLCSNVAMAMLVLRCVRTQAKENCNLTHAMDAYYASSSDSEWRFLEGDQLPPGALTTRDGQRILPEYAPILEFLNYLAGHVDPTPYDPQRTQAMDPALLAPHLATGSIKFSDVNARAPWLATRARLDQELKAGKGPSFVILSMLGWMYQMRVYLEFRRTPGGVRVTIPEHNEIVFEKDGAAYRLVELQQLMPSDL